VATKKDLEEQVARLVDESKASAEKLRTAQAEARRFQQDADRDHRNWQECESRLSSIRTVIESSLEVKHQTGVQPMQGEWFRGKFVEDVDTEDVRLLRHIHKLTMIQPPF